MVSPEKTDGLGMGERLVPVVEIHDLLWRNSLTDPTKPALAFLVVKEG